MAPNDSFQVAEAILTPFSNSEEKKKLWLLLAERGHALAVGLLVDQETNPNSGATVL